MAKWLAREVGYIYVDTGAMYRVATLFALRHGFITRQEEVQGSRIVIDEAAFLSSLPELSISFVLDPVTHLPQACLGSENVEQEIRRMEVSSCVSPVAALSFVREKLTQQQQEMGKSKGIVMDGRDIGTAVFPQAELKIFVTASAEVRAQRRYDELAAKHQLTNSDGSETTFDQVLANVRERDYIDSHRALNPLRQAADAVVLDNSHMTLEEQNAFLLRYFCERTQE